MWTYEKKLQFPVSIKNPNPKLAQLIITQFGGPDGELAASQRYLSQRYSMPYREVVGVLTDIGTEELAHMEMVCAIVHQLTRNLTRSRSRRSRRISSITRRGSTPSPRPVSRSMRSRSPQRATRSPT